MTIIENKVLINQPVDVVYNFLNDLNNHEQLMPENIYNWSSTVDEAKFTIQNMAKLALKVDSRIANQEITIIPSEKAPFDVQMKWLVKEIGNQTEVQLVISADLNMMMKMLASGPLQKLTDHQTAALQKKIS